jgi:hypothetical protein
VPTNKKIRTVTMVVMLSLVGLVILLGVLMS